MLNRRELLASLAVAASLEGKAKGPLTTTAAYLWQRKLGQQKRPLADGLEEIFTTTARSGYRRMELTSDFLQTELAPKVTELARRNKLEVPVFYYWATLHEPRAAEQSIAGIENVVDTAKSLGARILDLSVAWKPGKKPKTDSEMATEAKFVDRIAASVARRGIQTALHNHDMEMLDGAREWHHLMRNTDPKNVGACLDVDWIYRGGQKPAEIIGELPGRIALVHLRNSAHGAWTQELEEGEYDWPAVARNLKAARFDGYLVLELIHEPNETKVTRSVEDCLRRSRLYTEKTFGARS